MKTTHDFIRERLLEKLNLKSAKDKPEQTLEDILLVYKEPLEKCAQRLMFGALRYGPYRKRKKREHDYTPALLDRLNRYAESGNRDLLLDVINIAFLEYVFEGHPDSHYEPIDVHSFHDKMKID